VAFRAEVFLPFDRARSVTGWVEVAATALNVTAGGERFGLAPGSATLALGGHNGERVILEGEVAADLPRAGGRVYLQCPDFAFLAYLAAHGPQELRADAAQLSRRNLAVSRRWRTALIAAAVAAVVGSLLFYFFLDKAVQRAVAGIPIAWENALGRSLFAAMTAGRPRAPEKDAAVVKAAFERLRAHAAPAGYEFEYAVIESPEVNAFAIPGGKFVVFTGLLKRADRPEEVAGVLGHEFQHAILRHSLQKVVRAAGLQAALTLLVGDLEGLGGAIRSAGVQIQELSYGREQEREADLTAIDLLARAGVDPAGLPDFFDRLAAQEGGADGVAGAKALALLSTHPASAERSAALRAAIVKRGPGHYEPLVAP
jgi:predicted Zn-dependent protease